MPQATDGIVASAKAEKLRAFFAPDLIDWPLSGLYSAITPGTRVTLSPVLRYYALVDRLDAVLGCDGWRVDYENPGDGSYTRCVLSVRFASDGEWITRAGVSDSRDADTSHDEAFRAACRLFGVARYLDGQSFVTEVAGQTGAGGVRTLKDIPRLSQHLLPELFRECGRERSRTIRDLLASALKKATEDGCKSLPDENAALAEYVRRAAADPDGRILKHDGVYLSRIENRHADAILAYVNEWIADIAAGRPLALSAPIKPQTSPGEKKDEKKNTPQTPENKGTTATAGK